MKKSSLIISLIFAPFVLAALIVGGIELRNHWTDKTPEDIESLSTLALSILTVGLAAFNWRLAKDTHTALDLARDEFKLSQKQFDITQKQFESEWSADLRIAEVATYQGLLSLNITNLSRCVALVTTVRLGVEGVARNHLEPRNVKDYPYSCLAEAGNIKRETIEAVRAYVQEERVPFQRQMADVRMSISLRYDCAGQRGLLTDWYDFQMNIGENLVVYSAVRRDA